MNNPFSLQDKKLLVTGASSGIGRAIAVECSKMGASVIITGRDPGRLAETHACMEGSGRHLPVAADLCSAEGRDCLADAVADKLDGVVHCAGMAMPKPFRFYSGDDVDRVMGINFNAPMLLTQLLIKAKKISAGGSLVFISSISGISVSSVGGSIYSASKGAVSGMAKGLALELAPRGIRVNCICPGMIETDIFSDGVLSSDQLKEDTMNYPMGRYGKPEEVAYAAIYLLSDASKWVTGTNLLIDGGFTLL